MNRLQMQLAKGGLNNPDPVARQAAADALAAALEDDGALHTVALAATFTDRSVPSFTYTTLAYAQILAGDRRLQPGKYRVDAQVECEIETGAYASLFYALDGVRELYPMANTGRDDTNQSWVTLKGSALLELTEPQDLSIVFYRTGSQSRGVRRHSLVSVSAL